MDIEVTGATALEPGPPPRRPRRTAGVVVLALLVGGAFGFAVAKARPPVQTAAVKAAATPAAPAPANGLPDGLRERMLQRVGDYNKPGDGTVESSDVRIMTSLRGNLTRLDDPRSYPAGDYRLQVICLGDGQVWALFRIGEDETYADMDCHDDRVLAAQVVLTAKAGGRRTVTLVSDSPDGLAVGYQIRRSG